MVKLSFYNVYVCTKIYLYKLHVGRLHAIYIKTENAIDYYFS